MVRLSWLWCTALSGIRGARPLLGPPFAADAWAAIAANTTRATLTLDTLRSRLTWRFADGDVASMDMRGNLSADALPPRLRADAPGVFGRLENAPGDVAIVLAASSAIYARAWWPFVANKLNTGRQAGARVYMWVGSLPPAIAEPPAACLALDPQLLYTREHTISNHYTKVLAMLLALDESGVRAAIWIDMDAALPRPPPPAELRAVLAPGVSVYVQPSRTAHTWHQPWKRCGCFSAVRNDETGRRLLLLWLEKRCGFKDQPALWDSLVQLVLESGCVRPSPAPRPPPLSLYNFKYHLALSGDQSVPTPLSSDELLGGCVTRLRLPPSKPGARGAPAGVARALWPTNARPAMKLCYKGGKDLARRCEPKARCTVMNTGTRFRDRIALLNASAHEDTKGLHNELEAEVRRFVGLACSNDRVVSSHGARSARYR
ncbi:hypothetical protein KFE25_001012 [Diacronema lutheri]|uniref:Nucleotide-diphospho-sugar transferase domain-containing protein n=2 Tax=Diacronema lutheri TaxID=2081491 RepID=A0A8J5X333_DIALT|nr:hypothetical protein KFE25_001012 [Diacronema lutheri]